MNFFAISGLINGITSTLLGLYVFTRDTSDRRYQTYGLFCLSLSVWSYGYFFWHISENETAALLSLRVLMAGAIFIPVTNFHHIIEFLRWPSKGSRWIWLGYALCLILLLLDLFSFYFVRGVSPKLGFRFWPDPGPAFSIFLIFFFYSIVHFTYLLVREARKATGAKRNQLRYMILAPLIGYIGGSTNFPLWYDVPLLPYGNVMVSVYILIFSYAIVQHRLLDINIVIKQSLIYALLLLLLLVPCFLIVIWTQVAAFGVIDYTFSLFTLLLFVVVGFMYPKLRFRTEDALERVLFRKSYNYHNALLRSSKDMLSVIDLDTLSEKLVNTVSKALDIEKASLLLSDQAKGSFDLKASVGLSQDHFVGFTLLRDDPLVQGLIKRPEALIREELAMARNGQRTKDMAAKMGEMQAEVLVPLISKEKLIGILNLGSKDELYTNDDLEVLSTVANQVAIAIENAQLYEDLKQSQKVLQRADRLSSLGLLTAGLAHEIRNPLVAIRTFTQLLPERYEDPEFRENFKTLALKEVDRICGLVNDLLSFARPSVPKVSPEDANELVEGIVRILDTEAKEKEVALHLRLAPGLPKIFIDKEQIKQVFMNVVINAIQAIEGGGEVEVSTRMFSKDSSERFLQIEVRDSGIGIEEGDLENIFNPFFTTKKDGNGLGLSISHQIIQEHGGYMVADSKPGEGTAFYINLPAQLSHRPVNDMPGTNEKDLGH